MSAITNALADLKTGEKTMTHSQFTETLIRMVKEGLTDAQIIAKHSFGWRARAASRLREVRACRDRKDERTWT